MGILRGVLARRLALSFGALALLAMIAAAGSSLMIRSIEHALDRLSAQADIAELTTTIRSESLVLTDLVRRHTFPFEPKAADRPDLQQEITNQQRKLDDLVQKLLSITDPADSVERALILQLQKALQDYNKQVDVVIAKNKSEGAYGPATSHEMGVLTQTFQPALLSAISQLEELEADRVQTARSAARRLISITFIAMALIALLTLTGAAIMIGQAAAHIIVPLRALHTGVEQLQQGNLAHRLPVRGRDEIASLSDAFNTLASQLQQRIQAELAARQALEKLNAELEQRVAQRTQELELSHHDLQVYSQNLAQLNLQLQHTVAQNERRARLLEASTQVSRAAAVLRDPDVLLPRAMQLISEHFGFYHAGLFLLDERGEWAVLRAANSEGGQKMLARGHRLRVGEQGIVGWTAHTGKARIALDTGADAVHFDNPLLPHTRSEMALPLKVGDRILGVLDVQSTQEAAFSEEDVAALQSLADQLAIAIENARLFQQTQAALREAEEAQRRYIMREWAAYLQAGGLQTQEYAADPTLLVGNADLPEVKLALERKQTVALNDLSTGSADQAAQAARAALVAPIKLRDQIIGVLDLRETEQARRWSEDEIALTEAIASQVALAIENARLFEQAQTRVQQLSALNEISRVVSGLLESEPLLNAVYEQIQRIVKVDAFYVALYDAAAQIIHYLACYDEGQRYQQPPSPLRPGTGAYQVITSGKPFLKLLTPDEYAQITLTAEMAIGTIRPSASLLYVPMQIGDRITGVMSVQSYDFNAYTPEHINLISSIASQVAVALENARLFEQTRQQVQDLETINRIGQAITSALNLDQLLYLLYQHISALCQTNNFYVAIQSPELRQITFPIYVEHDKQIDVPPIPPEQGLTGYVINSGQPLLLRTRAELEALPVRYLGPPCASYLAVPIRAGERLAGVIAVQDFEREYAFNERHLRLLLTIAPQAATAIENTRLFEEARHRALQLATAAETGKAASALLDLDELLQNIVELIRIRFGYYHASIFLLDDSGQYAVLRESTGEVGRQMKEQGHKLAVGSQGIVGWVTGTGRSRVATDTGTDDVHFKNPLLPLTRSELAIPLKRGERVIGALDVQSTEPAAFNPDDVSVLELLADQIAIAIENARLYQAEQRRALRQAALYEVGRKMTGTLNQQELMNTVVEAVQRDLGFERVMILLVDEATHKLEIAAASANYADLIPPDYQPQFGVGLIGTAAASGQTQRANDTHTMPNYIALGKWDPRSELCVPLKIGPRVIGVLNVESDRPNAFDDQDALALESLADQLAVALENARLYMAEQQRRRESAALLEVARVVGESLDFDRLMGKVAQKVAQALETDRCTIFLLDEARLVLRPAASSFADGHTDLTLWEKFKSLPGEAVEKVPLCKQAIRTGRPIIFDRLQTPDGLPRSWYESFDLHTALIVSLMSKGVPLGIMVMDCGERRAFTPEQIALAGAMAAQAAMVIDNARMYQELSQTAERLREVDRLKSQFLANMSHELRTPLNSIIGFSRVILKGIDGPLTDMQRQDLEAIHSSGQHLLGLINDILDISKIEAGKMELSFEEVDMRATIKGVMSTAIGLVKGRPIELIQKVPDNLPTVWADQVRSRQVLLNLVSNAAKFTEKGSITVEATWDARFVRISVRDTGIGIPADKFDKIFEAFTQADASTTRKYGGTGLGLPIARRFVEMHGGEMWLESEVGVGTTFYFTLPRAKPDEAPRPAEQPTDVTTGKKIIVAIDDDPGVITLYRRYLEQQGYHVIGVSNSQQAVEQVRRFKPHAITLDILMPQKDGWEILQELKQNPDTRNIPVVVCSILSEQGKGFSLGAADYLVKPIMQDDLIATLKRLDGRAQTRVLVIDDRPEDIMLIRRMLEPHPQFIVIEATSGLAGIEAVHRDRPDLVILDLMMPQMDGFAVLETLKANPDTRDIPIVVVTAKTLTQEDLERLDDHIMALLSKGQFSEKDLLNDLAKALARMTRPRSP